jgi:integrase
MFEETTVKSGQVKITVKAYADGRYGFDYLDESRQRVKVRLKAPDKAVAEAKEAAKLIAAGRVEMLSASKDDWAHFQAWKSMGIKLEEIAEFRAWKSSRQVTKTVDEVTLELIAVKTEDADLDATYVTNLKSAWDLFAQSFGKRSIRDIQAGEIEAWLRGLNKSPRTRNNIRGIVVQLFRFARERDYLPNGEAIAAEKVNKLSIKARADDIEIWTPDELRKLIASVQDHYKPWMLLAAFAGIRTEEVRPNIDSHKDPLRWGDIQWHEQTIFVRAETAKTGRQRYVPISDNLFAWLQPYRSQDAAAPIMPSPINSIYEEIRRLERVTKLDHKKNALRHSYGSYRNAIIRNVGQLAEEMGNSPAIARKHYERPQPKSIAEEWFAIMP